MGFRAKGFALGQGLDGEDVQHGVVDPAALQRVEDRCLVHDVTPPDVDEDRRPARSPSVASAGFQRVAREEAAGGGGGGKAPARCA